MKPLWLLFYFSLKLSERKKSEIPIQILLLLDDLTKISLQYLKVVFKDKIFFCLPNLFYLRNLYLQREKMFHFTDSKTELCYLFRFVFILVLSDHRKNIEFVSWLVMVFCLVFEISH